MYNYDNTTTGNAQTHAKKDRPAKPLLAAYIRSSPKKSKESKESIDQQKAAILAAGYTRVKWYVDENISGDSADRPALWRLLEEWDNWRYPAIVVYSVDRLSRGWLGLKWLHEELIPRGIALKVVTGCPSLTDDQGNLIPHNYLFFGLTCLMAYADLLNIRRNTARGRAKAKAEGRYGGRTSYAAKQNAVAKVLLGASVTQTAQAIGVNASTLRRWVNEERQRSKLKT